MRDLYLESIRDTNAALRMFTLRNMPLAKLSLDGIALPNSLPTNVSAVCFDCNYSNITIQELYDVAQNFSYINYIYHDDFSATRDEIIAAYNNADRLMISKFGRKPPRLLFRADIRLSHQEVDRSEPFVDFLIKINMRPVIEAVNLRM